MTELRKMGRSLEMMRPRKGGTERTYWSESRTRLMGGKGGTRQGEGHLLGTHRGSD